MSIKEDCSGFPSKRFSMMVWKVLPLVLGSCLLFISFGEENEIPTELQTPKLDPVPSTGPKAMHRVEAAVFGLEQKCTSCVIRLTNSRTKRQETNRLSPTRRPRVQQRKPPKKSKPPGTFSALSFSSPHLESSMGQKEVLDD